MAADLCCWRVLVVLLALRSVGGGRRFVGRGVPAAAAAITEGPEAAAAAAAASALRRLVARPFAAAAARLFFLAFACALALALDPAPAPPFSNSSLLFFLPPNVPAQLALPH